MTPLRHAFVDWLKCIGMVLIVLGHTGAQNYFDPSPPIYFKQLGVAFFVFVMGFSLARETRSTGQVLWNRLFEVYLVGGAFAIAMSIITWIDRGDLHESNYLPFVLGANVLFNSFPANPTTWYIGTYLHLLLSWAILWRRIQVRLWMVLGCVLLEIPFRAALLACGQDYTAYMLLTNWTSLLLLGLFMGQESLRTETADARARRWPLLAVAGMIAVLTLWPRIIGEVGVVRGFPFSRLGLFSEGWLGLLVSSSAVSGLYLTYTLLAFRITRCFPASNVVTFFAKNTLLIFIAHMPLVYWLTPHVYPHVSSPSMRIVINLGLFLVLPAVCSELIRRLVQPPRMRKQLEKYLWPWVGNERAVR